MRYDFKLVTADNTVVKKTGFGDSEEGALEDILEQCLLDEPGIFFELNTNMSDNQDSRLRVVNSYGVLVESVSIKQNVISCDSSKLKEQFMKLTQE